MRRIILKIILTMAGVLLALLGFYALWAHLQLGISASLQKGLVWLDTATGELIFPELKLVYGFLAGVFLVATVVFIWLTYRLIREPLGREDKKCQDEMMDD